MNSYIPTQNVHTPPGGTWTQFPNKIVDLISQPRVRHALPTYVVLKWRADDNGKAWPTQQSIADLTGRCIRQVKRDINILVGAGLIEITDGNRSEEMTDRGGNGRINEYHIVNIDSEPGGHFRIYNAIITGFLKEVGDALGVYFVLCRHAGAKMEAYPSVPTIAKQVGVCDWTVQKYLRRLAGTNPELITIYEREGTRQYKSTRLYKINAVSGVTSYGDSGVTSYGDSGVTSYGDSGVTRTRLREQDSVKKNQKKKNQTILSHSAPSAPWVLPAEPPVIQQPKHLLWRIEQVTNRRILDPGRSAASAMTMLADYSEDVIVQHFTARNAKYPGYTLHTLVGQIGSLDSAAEIVNARQHRTLGDMYAEEVARFERLGLG